MPSRLQFFSTVLALMIAVGFIEWFVYQHGIPLLKNRLTLLIFIALPLTFFVPHFTELPLSLARVFAYAGGYWFAFTIYSLLFAALYFALFLGSFAIGHEHWSVSIAPYLARVLFCATALIVAVSAWWAQHHVYREVDIVTSKHLAQDLKIAFVTDIHLGTLWGNSNAEEMVRKINAAHPDLILFGGDMVDDSLDFVKREGSHRPLGNLSAPLGIYAIMGNHDYIARRPSEEIAMWEKEGIKFLVDASEVLPCGAELTGLRDWSQGHSAEQLRNDSDSKYFRILLDHQPRRAYEAQTAGYDLYLSGHTHAGQFWPIREATKRMYLLDYGTLQLGSLTHITSCGYGLWGIPVRNGPRPEVVIINVKRK